RHAQRAPRDLPRVPRLLTTKHRPSSSCPTTERARPTPQSCANLGLKSSAHALSPLVVATRDKDPPVRTKPQRDSKPTAGVGIRSPSRVLPRGSVTAVTPLSRILSTAAAAAWPGVDLGGPAGPRSSGGSVFTQPTYTSSADGTLTSRSCVRVGSLLAILGREDFDICPESS